MDIKAFIEGNTGIKTADTAFRKPQKLPFITFIDKQRIEGDDELGRILIEHDLSVELYTEKLESDMCEKKLEALFLSCKWKYQKDRLWLADEKCFETIYSMSFIERVKG